MAMNKRTEKFNLGILSAVNFNVMVAGEDCCGKTTFLQSFALPYTKGNGTSADRLLLGDSYNCFICFEEGTVTASDDLKDFLTKKHNEFIVARSQLVTVQEEQAMDERIHCLVYMFGPHRVLQTDRDCLQSVRGLVPVVPVLAKADPLTATERHDCIQDISELLAELGIGIVFQSIGQDDGVEDKGEDNFPLTPNAQSVASCDTPPPADRVDTGTTSAHGVLSVTSTAQLADSFVSANIFALVCSGSESGLREYPWGCSVSAYDERVSDLRRLQRLVFERGNIARLRDLTQHMTIALHRRDQDQRTQHLEQVTRDSCKRKRTPPEPSVEYEVDLEELPRARAGARPRLNLPVKHFFRISAEKLARARKAAIEDEAMWEY